MRTSRFLLAFSGWLSVLAGCTTDASLTKELVGTSWSWKPRAILPKEQISEDVFPTPDFEAVQFGADGRFTLVQTTPGYDTLVGGTTVHVPDYWTECHGSWSVSKGKLALQEDSADDRWAARHDPKGWGFEDTSTHGCRMFSYTIVEHQRHRLQLKAVAIGDYDRTLERSSTMPARPTLSAP